MRTTFPRSLNEAFGPYSSQLAPLVERIDPMPTSDKIVTAISVAGLLAVAVMAIFGVI